MFKDITFLTLGPSTLRVGVSVWIWFSQESSWFSVQRPQITGSSVNNTTTLHLTGHKCSPRQCGNRYSVQRRGNSDSFGVGFYLSEKRKRRVRQTGTVSLPLVRLLVPLSTETQVPRLTGGQKRSVGRGTSRWLGRTQTFIYHPPRT